MARSTYSFLDVQAALTGPGGAISLGAGAGAADEGISVEFAADTDSMQIGADGTGGHSLIADKSGRITVRLLKTSPVNQQLSAMFAFQRTGSSTHGQNTLVITDVGRGDLVSARQVAFARAPNLSFSREAGMNEWIFNAIEIDMTLGGG